MTFGGTISWPLGSHSWTAPAFAGSATISVAGGGGGGYSDNAGPGSNGRGGGGGAGGTASGGGNLTPLASYSITVGGGGGVASNGGTSTFSGPGIFVSAGGGGGGQDRPGGFGGFPNGAPGSGDGSKEAPGDGSGGGGPGGAGGPGNIKGSRGASGGQPGYVTMTWYYAAPTASISINGPSVLTEGECTNLLYSNQNVTSSSITNIGTAAGNGNFGVKVCPTSTTSYTHNVSGPGGSASAGPVTVTVYPKPTIDTFYIGDPDNHIGDSVTVYWTTTNASYVALSGSTNAWGTDIPSNPKPVDGSHTFTPLIGGFYNATLTAQNPAGYTVTSTINWRTRDETPNAFSWADSDENTPLNNENLQSNSITINGFGPTQYTSNALPIKSNHPIQVQVNSDGVWRDVQAI